MSCTPPRPEVPRNRCSMRRRLPWARRLQSPCRIGEPSPAAQSIAPTRLDELADIADKPCARRQRRASSSDALLVAAVARSMGHTRRCAPKSTSPNSPGTSPKQRRCASTARRSMLSTTRATPSLATWRFARRSGAPKPRASTGGPTPTRAEEATFSKAGGAQVGVSPPLISSKVGGGAGRRRVFLESSAHQRRSPCVRRGV